MKKLLTVLIIISFPVFVLAHEEHDEETLQKYQKQANILPGEIGYIFDRLGDWVRINLLTLSTKQKQQKKLLVSQERFAELVTLVEVVPGKVGALAQAVEEYKKYLWEGRDMAQKIIILDGTEIELGRELELVTRENEEILSSFLESANPTSKVYVLEALIAARIENEEIFKFMVKNYQFTQSDIQANREIIEEHLKFVEEKFPLSDEARQVQAEGYLREAREFQKAGLNVEAYDFIKSAKNLTI